MFKLRNGSIVGVTTARHYIEYSERLVKFINKCNTINELSKLKPSVVHCNSVVYTTGLIGMYNDKYKELSVRMEMVPNETSFLPRQD